MVVSFSTKLILIYIPARSAGGELHGQTYDLQIKPPMLCVSVTLCETPLPACGWRVRGGSETVVKRHLRAVGVPVSSAGARKWVNSSEKPPCAVERIVIFYPRSAGRRPDGSRTGVRHLRPQGGARRPAEPSHGRAALRLGRRMARIANVPETSRNRVSRLKPTGGLSIMFAFSPLLQWQDKQISRAGAGAAFGRAAWTGD